jgi:hypothetical protein
MHGSGLAVAATAQWPANRLVTVSVPIGVEQSMPSLSSQFLR